MTGIGVGVGGGGGVGGGVGVGVGVGVGGGFGCDVVVELKGLGSLGSSNCRAVLGRVKDDAFGVAGCAGAPLRSASLTRPPGRAVGGLPSQAGGRGESHAQDL